MMFLYSALPKNVSPAEVWGNHSVDIDPITQLQGDGHSEPASAQPGVWYPPAEKNNNIPEWISCVGEHNDEKCTILGFSKCDYLGMRSRKTCSSVLWQNEDLSKSRGWFFLAAKSFGFTQRFIKTQTHPSYRLIEMDPVWKSNLSSESSFSVQFLLSCLHWALLCITKETLL